MSYRGNQNQNRNRNFGGNMAGGVGANRMGNINMSPWGTPNSVGNFGGSGVGMRQGGGGGGQMNAQALNLANNLLNNLFRNQNPPSLLDLPRGGGGGGMGNRNQRGGPMLNRSGGGAGGGGGGGGGGGNRSNNRRMQGNFSNRGPPGGGGGNKSNQKSGGTGGGIRKQNAFDRAKKVLAKSGNNNNAQNKKKDANDKPVEGAKGESAYAEVPNDMFYCHLCKKHMWDAPSFENHIKGRTHLMIRESIEESYRLKANMIRQEAKIAEQLKSIELDRLKRMGKTKQRQSEYCTMCDLNFNGHISVHRKSEGHLLLKKFLHPKCTECNEEFATRIDFDSHLLCADHLIKAAEKNTKVGERKRPTLVVIHSADEESKDVRLQQRRKKKPITPVKKEGEIAVDTNTTEDGIEIKKEVDEQQQQQQAAGAEVAEGAEAAEGREAGADETKDDEDLNETQEDEEITPPVDAEDCILDFNDGDDIPTEVDTRLPKYNSLRPVGNSFIKKLACFECSLCGKFLEDEKTEEIHARTATHHRNFVKFINELASDAKIAKKRAAAALEHSERKKRRIEAAAAAEANGHEVKVETAEGVEEVGEQQTEEHAADDNEELYDPAEATGDGDDEDVEMREGEPELEEEAMADDEADDLANKEAQMQAEDATTTAAVVETTTTTAAAAAATPVAKPVAKAAETKTVAPVKATPVKAAQATATTAAATIAATAAVAGGGGAAAAAAANANNGTPAQSPQSDQGSARKQTAIRGGGTATRGTPRGRGRGRYNRY